MTNLNIYKELTFIETYDNEIRTLTASVEDVSKLLKEEKFLNLWNELINVSNIKRVYSTEMTDVDKVIYSIQDKQIRDKVKADVEQRKKDWLRISVGVIENLLSKYQ